MNGTGGRAVEWQRRTIARMVISECLLSLGSGSCPDSFRVRADPMNCKDKLSPFDAKFGHYLDDRSEI